MKENNGGKTQVVHHFTHGITNSICITSLSGFDVTPVVIQFQHNRFVFASPSSFLLGDLHIYSVHWPLAGDWAHGKAGLGHGHGHGYLRMHDGGTRLLDVPILPLLV